LGDHDLINMQDAFGFEFTNCKLNTLIFNFAFLDNSKSHIIIIA